MGQAKRKDMAARGPMGPCTSETAHDASLDLNGYCIHCGSERYVDGHVGVVGSRPDEWGPAEQSPIDAGLERLRARREREGDGEPAPADGTVEEWQPVVLDDPLMMEVGEYGCPFVNRSGELCLLPADHADPHTAERTLVGFSQEGPIELPAPALEARCQETLNLHCADGIAQVQCRLEAGHAADHEWLMGTFPVPPSVIGRGAAAVADLEIAQKQLAAAEAVMQRQEEQIVKLRTLKKAPVAWQVHIQYDPLTQAVSLEWPAEVKYIETVLLVLEAARLDALHQREEMIRVARAQQLIKAQKDAAANAAVAAALRGKKPQ